MSPAKFTDSLTAQAISNARNLDRLAVSVLGNTQAVQSNRHRIFAMATAVRSLNYFRAVVRLIESELYEPAGASLRVMLELIFVLKAVHQTPERIDLLAMQSLGENRKASNGLANVSKDSRPDWLTDEVIQAELSGFDAKQPGFSAAFWAVQSGNSEAYNTMYRRLCGFSHGALGALEAYLPVNENGHITAVRNDVGKEFGPQFLVSATSILLEVLQIVEGDDLEQSRREEFAQMGAALVQLQEQIISVSTDHPAHGAPFHEATYRRTDR